MCVRSSAGSAPVNRPLPASPERIPADARLREQRRELYILLAVCLDRISTTSSPVHPPRRSAAAGIPGPASEWASAALSERLLDTFVAFVAEQSEAWRSADQPGGIAPLSRRIDACGPAFRRARPASNPLRRAPDAARDDHDGRGRAPVPAGGGSRGLPTTRRIRCTARWTWPTELRISASGRTRPRRSRPATTGADRSGHDGIPGCRSGPPGRRHRPGVGWSSRTT